MADRLFEPDPATSVRRLSLVRLSAEVARSLASVGRIAVEGEVVRPSRTGSGGVWFVLRDRAAQVSVRCGPARAARCRTVAGERVLVTGSLVYSNERGALHLNAEEVVPVGDGAIAAHLADVRARLDHDGLTRRPRRPIPKLPRGIGVVCGTDAAVQADIESVVAARYPGYPVHFVAANVSAPGAADSIAAAVRALDGRDDVEVIVLARGGGDATQLLPFSDEALCRLLCELTKPVVSAIGHEGDRPLCDDVADLRCGTPSLAAAAVVPDRAALEAELAALSYRRNSDLDQARSRATRRLAAVDASAALRSGLAVATRRLDLGAERLTWAHPRRAVAGAADRLHRLDWRAPVTRRSQRAAEQLRAARRHLDALDPERVLERGYAVVRDEATGAVLRSAAALAGPRIGVQLASGRLEATVDGMRP